MKSQFLGFRPRIYLLFNLALMWEAGSVVSGIVNRLSCVLLKDTGVDVLSILFASDLTFSVSMKARNV